jgi:hypothetical protein
MIEILNYEKANKNKIIGYVDIRLPKWNNMIIRRIAHVQGDGGRRWFNLPTFPREKGDGTQDYVRYWEFETQVYNGQLLEELPELVKQYCLQNKIAETTPLNFSAPPIDMSEDLPF